MLVKEQDYTARIVLATPKQYRDTVRRINYAADHAIIMQHKLTSSWEQRIRDIRGKEALAMVLPQVQEIIDASEYTAATGVREYRFRQYPEKRIEEVVVFFYKGQKGEEQYLTYPDGDEVLINRDIYISRLPSSRDVWSPEIKASVMPNFSIDGRVSSVLKLYEAKPLRRQLTVVSPTTAQLRAA